jgi:TonB family protein
MEVPEERDLEMSMYSTRVRYAIQRYYARRAQRCFERATRNNPQVAGTVVVALTIGTDGQVQKGSVSRNTTGNDALGKCLASEVQQWKLSPPPGDEPLTMELPFSR